MKPKKAVRLRDRLPSLGTANQPQDHIIEERPTFHHKIKYQTATSTRKSSPTQVIENAKPTPTSKSPRLCVLISHPGLSPPGREENDSQPPDPAIRDQVRQRHITAHGSEAEQTCGSGREDRMRSRKAKRSDCRSGSTLQSFAPGRFIFVPSFCRCRAADSMIGAILTALHSSIAQYTIAIYLCHEVS